MQTAYSTKPAVAVEGMIAESRIVRNIVSRFAYGVIKAGRGVFRTAAFSPNQADSDSLSPGQVHQTISPALALDVDSVATAAVIKSVALGVTYLAAVADGVVGAGYFRPARKLTVTFDGHADWDPGTGTITFENEFGDTVTENLAVATSAALTTTGKARRFISITLPVATGTGGTATIGHAVTTYVAADFDGVAVYDASIESPADAIAAGVEYGDEMALPVLDRGCIYVFPEQAVTPSDAVFVRIVTGAGGTNIGAFRKDADTSTAVELTKARWRSVGAIGAPTVLELGY